MRNTLVVIVGALVLVAAAALLLRPHRPRPEGPPRVTGTDPVPPPVDPVGGVSTPVGSEPRPTWTGEPVRGLPCRLALAMGEGATYRFRFGQTLRMDLSGSPADAAAPPGLVIDASGTVTLTVYEATASGLVLVLGYRFEGTTLDMRGGEGTAPPEVAAEVAKTLDAEILARVDPRGRPAAYRLPPGGTAEGRNFHRDWLTRLRFVLAPGPGITTWDDVYRDATGEAVDRYEARADAGGNGFPVAKTRTYRALGGDIQDMKATGTGVLEGRLEASGILRSLHGSLRLAFENAGDDAPLHLAIDTEMTTHLDLEALRTGPKADPAAAAALYEALLANEGAWIEDLRPEPVESLLAGVAGGNIPADASAADLAAALERALSQGRWVEEAPHLFLALAAVLRKDPEAVTWALTEAGAGRYALRVRQTLIDALGECGSPAAARGLLAMAADASTVEDLVPSIYLALATPTEPLDEVVQALEASLAATDPRAARWGPVAVGVLASHLADGEMADRLAERLADGLGQLDRDRDLLLLEALGNAGRETTADVVSDFLEGDDTEFRGAAVTALRKVPGERVDEVVAVTAVYDDDAEVRLQAVHAMKGRPGEVTRDAILDVLEDDASPAVRLAAVGEARARIDDPQVRKVLQATMRDDEDPEVRAAAEAALRGE